MAEQKSNAASDDKLAVALAGGKAIVEAAAEAGMSERTAYRRLANEKFRAKVDGLRAAALERAVNILGQAAVEAAEELRRLVKEATKEDAQKIHAIRLLLETAYEGAKLVELQQKVNKLLAASKGKGKGNGTRHKLSGMANREAGTGGRGAGDDGYRAPGEDPAAADGDIPPGGFEPRPFAGEGFDFASETDTPQLLPAVG